MQIGDHIHAIRVPFAVRLAPGRSLDRRVWVYVVSGERVYLIDAGVAGSWPLVADCLEGIGRRPAEIELCIFTHSHPDHIGAARTVRAETGCRLAAHTADRSWIEDVELQARERPVPGFFELVEGAVQVDRVLGDGDRIELGGRSLRVIHTPGHSPGHIALLDEHDGTLITGDALVEPGFMPTYTDAADTVRSLRRLCGLDGVELVLSSLDDAPIAGDQIADRIDAAIAHVCHVHRTVRESQAAAPDLGLPQRTADVMKRLGLPPFAANPISALAIASHLDAAADALSDER